ncbi:MAG TPA: Cof-type HAD-IIB family hydrolase [Stenomitos sp.]
MRPKLIATDIDGTLIGRDLVVTERTKRAFRRAHDAGIPIVMATGRMYRATLPLARECAITTPLITYQGALIRDHQTQEELWHRTIPMDLAHEALEALFATKLHVNLYVDDELLIERVTPESELYCSIAKVEPRVVPSLASGLTGEPTKIVAIGSVEDVQRWLPGLQEQFGDRLYVTESLPVFIEIANPTVSKSAALDHVARRMGIQPAEIVAFGDGMNDLDMLQYAGLGVAMGNAPRAVKERADRVTKPVSEDGLACVLEELLN